MPRTNSTATHRTGARAHGSVRWECVFSAIISSLMLVTPLAAQTWGDPDWYERKKLTFRNGDQTENLLNFPVLVKLDSSRIDYTKTQNAGEDLRFIDSNDTTQLYHEIEKWDEAGTSYVWVKVPQIDGSSNADYIWMYYDNPFAPPASGPPPSVPSFDAATPDFSSTARSSASFSHTVGAGSDPVLIVIVMTRGDQGAASVSYAAQPLAPAISEQASTAAGVEWVSIWYLAGPATGPNTVSVTFNSSLDPTAVVALSYFGVDQSDPIGATAGASSNSSSSLVSVDITTTVDNSMVVGGLGHHGPDTAPHTPGAAITDERFDLATGGNANNDSGHAGGEIATTTAGTYTFQWTGSASDDYAIACVELKGYVGGAGGVWSNGYLAVWHLREDPTGGGGPWYNPSWQYRKKVTIAGAKVVGTHIDFPVLVSITDTDLKVGAQSDGDDILFTNSDETTKLDHEIETYVSATGELVAWVRVPSLSAGVDKDIYLYYGNSGATNQQNAPGVWGDYVGVWHLNETSGTRVDSTSSNNDLTDQNTVGSATGIMAGGIDLERNNSERLWISDAAQTGLDITGNMTMQAWVKPESVPESITFLNKYDGSGGYRMRIHTNSWFEYAVYDGSTNEVRSNIPANTGVWRFLVGVYDGSNVIIYTDNIDVDSTGHSGGINANSEPFEIGARANGNFFDGLVDEVRICAIARSAGWLETEYNNQNDPGTFHTLGPESTGGSGAVNDSTANAHHGAAHASMNVFDQVPGQIDGSLDFDGGDDEVSTATTTALDNAPAVTLEAWVKAGSQFEWAAVIQKRSNATSVVPASLGVRASGLPRFGVWTSGFTPIESASALSNVWTHLVGVYDGNDLRLYRNGSLDAGPISKTGNLVAISRPFYIGRNPWDSVTFNGGVDEVRVSDSARSADWIAAQYKSMTDTFIRWRPKIITWREVEP